ncbi:Uncharacterised protein [Burkholderia oklahomensis]|nr:hypothetical protein BG90_5273 [Burkholderia oklahomensis C6786]SUY26957.1 Uncharacterised protein [Burkholderia oklahomensis]
MASSRSFGRTTGRNLPQQKSCVGSAMPRNAIATIIARPGAHRQTNSGAPARAGGLLRFVDAASKRRGISAAAASSARDARRSPRTRRSARVRHCSRCATRCDTHANRGETPPPRLGRSKQRAPRARSAGRHPAQGRRRAPRVTARSSSRARFPAGAAARARARRRRGPLPWPPPQPPPPPRSAAAVFAERVVRSFGHRRRASGDACRPAPCAASGARATGSFRRAPSLDSSCSRCFEGLLYERATSGFQTIPGPPGESAGSRRKAFALWLKR